MINLPGGTVVRRFLFQKRYASTRLAIANVCDTNRRPSANDNWRQYNVNIQRFEHDVVSIRSMWQGRHGA